MSTKEWRAHENVVNENCSPLDVSEYMRIEDNLYEALHDTTDNNTCPDMSEYIKTSEDIFHKIGKELVRSSTEINCALLNENECSGIEYCIYDTDTCIPKDFNRDFHAYMKMANEQMCLQFDVSKCPTSPREYPKRTLCKLENNKCILNT